MKKALQVFRYEFVTAVSRRSFLLMLILVPLVPTLLLGAVRLLNRGQDTNIQQMFTETVANPLPYGVVDLSGIIQTYPDWIVYGQLVPVADEATARAQTEAGQLEGYYVISADYIATGEVLLVKPEVNLISEVMQDQTLVQLLNYHLLGANQDLYLKFTNPTQIVQKALNPGQANTRDPNSLYNYYMPYAVLIFFYMFVLISASMMLSSVSKDKENRVMEILISSLKPTEMFVGKILALGLVSLIQMVVWFGTIVLVMRSSGDLFSLTESMQLPTETLVLAVPFFVLGFFLYGSLMAGLGAIAPNLREANQSSFVIMMPLIFTILANAQLIQNPQGGLSVFLSLFPFTSPVAMMTRLAIGGVPALQVGLSLIILLGTVFLVVKGVSNLFRAQTLLTGQKFKLNEFLRAMAGG
jgi:ABC-2 type transport system permease protein